MSWAATSTARAAVRFAAIATVCVAVGMDLLAGEHPWHAATIGLIAVVVAALRVQLAGSYSGYFSALSGALVAQPALHAATKLLPPSPDTAAGHAAESSVSVAHILLAALIVAAVTGAQTLFALLAAAHPLARLVCLLARPPVPSGPAVPLRRADAVPVVRWFLVADVSRRGPPRGALAAG